VLHAYSGDQIASHDPSLAYVDPATVYDSEEAFRLQLADGAV
jgi:hypothetical protein